MKTVTFDEARNDFERLFQLAARGETVVIQREEQQVALKPHAQSREPEIAPPGHFSSDYSSEEAAELNALAALAPHAPLPESAKS
ncbi:MAG: hypothetical protein FJ403_13650 [Verrucomicrobia bacterium]|nr:hypothetical protein [Verrucomicrobiota bacterium]